jgi:hypothetical protein
MHILFGIGISMMMTVMRRPPERPVLQRCCSDKPDQKLKRAGCLVGTMREIPMVTGSYREHS